MSRRHGLMLVALAAIWGASFLFIKVGVRGFAPITLIWLRCAFASLLLVPLSFVMLGTRESLARLRETAGLMAVMGLFNSAVPFWLITWGEKYVDSGLAGILNASAPLFTALLAIRFDQRERVTGPRLLGVLIGFGGVVLLVGAQPQGGSKAVLGGLAVVLAALFYAGAALYGGRRLRGVDPLVISTGSMVTATLFSLPWALAEVPAEAPNWKEWGSVIALGLLGTGVGYILYFGLIVGAGASRAILVTYLVPPMALFYGALILDEPVTAGAVGGLALILGGVALGTGAVRLAGRRPTPVGG